jgi:hypothetical protein
MVLKFEVGKFYRTRDGSQVRVVCTNADSEYPIIGLVKDENGEEVIETFTSCGSYDPFLGSCMDLVSECPVPLTKFQIEIEE